MTIYSLLPLIASIFSIFLILLVWINNRKKEIIFPYTLLVLSGFLWNFGIFLLYSSSNIHLVNKYNHLLVVGTMFIFSSYYYFVINLTKRKTILNKFLIYVAFSLSFIFLFLHFKLNILSFEVKKYFWGYYPKEGIGDRIYTIIFLFFFTYSQILLYKEIQISLGQKKNQYKFIFWSTLIGYIGGLTNFFPFLKVKIYPIGNIASVFYALAVAYALITVKMVNLYYLLKRILIFGGSLVTFIVVALFTAYLFIPSALKNPYLYMYIILGICVVFFFTRRLYNTFYHFINLRFSEEKRLMDASSRMLAIRIKKVLNQKELISDFLEEMPKIFTIEKGALLFFSKDKYRLGEFINKRDRSLIRNVRIEENDMNSIELFQLIYHYFQNNTEIIIRDVIEKKLEMGKQLSGRDVKLYQEMLKREYVLALPLMLDKEVKGALLIGIKFSGDMYDDDEIDIFSLLRESIETSLQNIINVEILKEQERKLIEEQEKGKKIESLKVIAGGVAHDFNNLLTTMLGNINLAKMELVNQKDLSDLLHDAEHAMYQAKDLTGQLIAFSKDAPPKKTQIFLPELIQHSIDIYLKKTNIQYDVLIPNDLWSLEADESQINQVINNLILNACQAMNNEGELKIICENILLNDKSVVHLPPGKYIKTSFHDKGIGISKENIEKIFDPYFSTKKKGHGLGLAITFSNITKHGGYINVESEVGKGTTFYFYLPALDNEK